MEKIRVLYVEDDRLIANMSIQFLQQRSFVVYHALNGDEGWRLYRQLQPDVVLLDVKMPGMNGLELAQLIRMENEEVPILFISSLVEATDVVEGLKIGANDYIRKECMLEEVEARIYSALRGVGVLKKGGALLSLGKDSTLNAVELLLDIRGKQIRLTPMETSILKVLHRHKNRMVSKSVLMTVCWGYEDLTISRYLDKYIVQLRKKLSEDPTVSIVTQWRTGLTLVCSEE